MTKKKQRDAERQVSPEIAAAKYAAMMASRWNDVSFDEQPGRFRNALEMAYLAGARAVLRQRISAGDPPREERG